MGTEIHWQPGVTLDEIEREVIYRALRYFQSNKTKTAQSLGIAIRTLDNKLARYEGRAEEPEGTRESPSARVYVEPAQEVPQERKVPMRKR